MENGGIVWNGQDEFEVVYNNSKIEIIGDEWNADLIETNDLCSLRASIPFEEDVILGQNIPISIDIENIGGIVVNSVSVMVNGSAIGSFPINGGLNTGEATTIDFNLPIPTDMSEQTDFEIAVEPEGLINSDSSDNSRIITLGYSNLSLELENLKKFLYKID